MKVINLFRLKEMIMADKRQFTQKDYSKEIEYKATIENILVRIKYIEEGRIKEEKWLRDIDKHRGRMKDRLKIEFNVEEPADTAPKEEAASSIIPPEINEHNQ